MQLPRTPKSGRGGCWRPAKGYSSFILPIEVIILNGPLAGTQGLTVEMPAAGEPWPEARWRDPDWRWLVYQFETMSQGLPSFPVYKLANGSEE